MKSSLQCQYSHSKISITFAFYITSSLTLLRHVHPVGTPTLTLQPFCCITSSCVLLSDAPQRKELGVVVHNCSCLALDLHRVFSFYWQLHERDYIPSIWSKRVTALYGRHDALELQLNAAEATAYLSVRNGFVIL